MKRAVDIVLSTALLLLAAPVILVTAVGSAIALRAWPIFTQNRIGIGGAPFRFVKLRTLPPDTPRYTDKYAVQGLDIPLFARAVRRLHLDELPQLLLVLIGRMSLVGPRPEMPHLHRHFPPEFARLRTSVRPGCTGLWQVSSSCTGLIGEAPEVDAFYVRHRSLRLDLWIMARTVMKVMPGPSKRLVGLDDVPRWVLGQSEPVAEPAVASVRSEPCRNGDDHHVSNANGNGHVPAVSSSPPATTEVATSPR